jgi:hypothetical protein
MTYSPSHGPSASLQQSSPSAMSRLRASSSVYPPGLDLRNQYRALPSQQHGGVPHTPRSSSFSNAFTGGFASAPLTAPVDFSLPRTPIDGGSGGRDFNIPQLSAPMAPPGDFQNFSPVRAQQGDRDFGSQGQNNGDSSQTQTSDQQQQSQQQQQQQQQARNNEEASYLRPIEYETGQKRKRSFTMPGQFESS